MLLLVTEVLAGARELVQDHGRGHGIAGVELDVIEAVALQPDGLLAAVFGQLVARPGVIQVRVRPSTGANCTATWAFVRSRSESENA